MVEYTINTTVEQVILVMRLLMLWFRPVSKSHACAITSKKESVKRTSILFFDVMTMFIVTIQRYDKS